MYSVTNDETQTRSFSRVKWWPDLAILSIVCGLFLFSHIGAVSFLDPDEGMYGSIAREMAEKGDWVTPHFNGVRYLAKPPLQFWLSALTIAAFGPSEWSVRLWSALPAFGIVLLIWRIGANLYGQSAGLIAGIVFATSVGAFVYTRVTMPDFLLIFALTLTMFGFIRYQCLAVESQWPGDAVNHHSSMTFYSLLFWLGMALGVLSKGLIGIIFPIVILGFYLLLGATSSQLAKFTREPRRIGISPLVFRYSLFTRPAGLLLFLGVTVPWHVVAAWKNPGFFNYYILDNQLLRFFNSRGYVEDDVPMGTFAFLAVTFLWFFPWSLFLPAAIREVIPKWSTPNSSAGGGQSVIHDSKKLTAKKESANEASRLLIGAWALGVLLFFTLSRSKLEYYGLPAFPALSIMVGATWARALQGIGHKTAEASRHGADWDHGPSPERSVTPVCLRRCLGGGAVACGLVGLSLLIAGNLIEPQTVIAGFGQLNGYYRTLVDQGVDLPVNSIRPFFRFLGGVGMALVVGLPLSYFLFSRNRLISFVVLVVVSGAIAWQVHRLNFVLESHQSTLPISQGLLARIGPGDRIVHEGSLDYSAGLPFYTGHQVSILNGTRGALDFGSRYHEVQHLFLKNTDFHRLWKGSQRIFLVTGLMSKESVIEGLPHDKVILVDKYGTRRLYTNKPLK
ncbi:MAG: glycosyltransferase family 39 protein [Deltaproteobacteria bacterium]|nr:glycosyltransferase family 39 protein [Deltaproteobacteria bacterium]